jgi:hypothetical protein
LGPGTDAEIVRKRIEASGERVWRLVYFEGMPFGAVPPWASFAQDVSAAEAEITKRQEIES